VFLRRAFLDLAGMLPTAEEAREFAGDSRPDKRARVIDELLERPEFADFWALKWSDLLRNEERALDRKGVEAFHHWIRRSLMENRPLDEFVGDLISAKGSTYQNPPANFHRANRTPVIRAEAAAQLFLGVRLNCAQCHNHPFDRWTQKDYYDWAAVFAKVDYKVLENRRRDNNDSHEFIGEQVVFRSPRGEVTNPVSGHAATPGFLGESGGIGEGADELEALAAWMTSPKNPWFARVQANRVWFHLMGRGLVDPIDDFRATNPASHPELLDAMARDLVEHEFDLRHLIRVIMNSRAYQLTSEPNETNADDELNYSHARVRRLSAEQLLDAMHQVAGVPNAFPGYPVGMRAVQLPGTGVGRHRGRRNGEDAQFLGVFGKPDRLLTCECERSAETTMSQAFEMISGPVIDRLLSETDNRLGRLLADGHTESAIVDELFWTALGRAPTPGEADRLVPLLAEAEDRRRVIEDITWGLLNAKEFVLRR
jgi:hypothetical protein